MEMQLHGLLVSSLQTGYLLSTSAHLLSQGLKRMVILIADE